MILTKLLLYIYIYIYIILYDSYQIAYDMLPIVKCKPHIVYLRIEMSWTQVENLLLGVYGISSLMSWTQVENLLLDVCGISSLQAKP